MRMPDKTELFDALLSAGAAHHEYQTNALGGQNDELWAGWYAAYVLGRLGDFAQPSELTALLTAVTGDGDWTELAAGYVVDKLS